MTGGLSALIGRLRESLRPAEGRMLPDAELLRRWTSDRDQAAFELLVWRHGRLVLSVCQRLLSRTEDVEDAFQATFLVLVRKAASITHRQALASWLHTVAYRVSIEARERATRRQQTSYPLDEVPARPGDSEGELREVIDEEVRRLPEKYRQPFVLCCLEGRTNEEAARELGRPVGTILSQLSRARQRLRERLTRRGLAPELLGPALAKGSAVSSNLVDLTVQAALGMTGKNLAAGAVKASAVVLMEGALHSMLIAKLKFTAAVVLSLVFLGTGGGIIGYRALSAGEAGTGIAIRSVKRFADPNPQVEELKVQLKKAQDQIAQLKEALMRAEEAAKRAAAVEAYKRAIQLAQTQFREKAKDPPAVTTRTPTVDRDDVELLKIRAKAKEAELEAAKVMAEEARRRLKVLEQNNATVPNSTTPEDLGAAKVTVVRYQAEVKLKEAELQEALLHLKRAERLLPATTTPVRSLEQRVKALEDQLAEMKKELDRLRADRKGGSSRR